MADRRPAALCLHGLGGTGATMAPVVHALAAAGFDAVAPTLPGHGTTPEELLAFGWADWLSVATCASWDVIVGQSMGAALALAAAAAGACRRVVAINPPAPDPDAVEGLEWRRGRGHTWLESPPLMAGEDGYTRLPIEALLSMAAGTAAIDLAAVTRPVLLVTSADDDVVDPFSADLVAAARGGPVERLTLAHGSHAATLGLDQALLLESIVSFCRDS
jgi:carboxylesterase